jgi:hypothetical protein
MHNFHQRTWLAGLLALSLGLSQSPSLSAGTPDYPYHRAPACQDGNCPPQRQTNGHYETRWRPWPVNPAQPNMTPPGVRNNAPNIDVPTREKELDLPKRAMPKDGNLDPNTNGANVPNELRNVVPPAPVERPLPNNQTPTTPGSSSRMLPSPTIGMSNSPMTGPLPLIVDAPNTGSVTRPASGNSQVETIVNTTIRQAEQTAPELSDTSLPPRMPTALIADEAPQLPPVADEAPELEPTTRFTRPEPLQMPSPKRVAPTTAPHSTKSLPPRAGSEPLRIQVDSHGEMRPGMIPATHENQTTLRITSSGVKQVVNLEPSQPLRLDPVTAPVIPAANAPMKIAPRSGSVSLDSPATKPALFIPDHVPTHQPTPMAIQPAAFQQPVESAAPALRNKPVPQQGNPYSPIRGMSNNNPLR